MEEKKKIGNRKLLVIAIVLILVVIIGTTYAWLRISQESKIINKITAGSLELTLDDKASEGIKLIKAIPMSYQQGITTEEYTFTLTNKSSTSSYTLSLKDLTTYTNDNNEEITIADADRLADSKVRYILLKDGEEATASKSKILTDRVIDSGTIEKGKTITYSLRIWIDSKAGDDNTEAEVMGKVFNAQLSLEATQTVTPTKTAVCKRATTLHTEECTETNTTYHCSGAGYTASGSKKTSTITYGNLGTKGTLSSGDAFDCDVNGDGIYDPTTERFYYVTDMDDNTAVLIYYNNVSAGSPSNSATYAYDSSGENFHGPRTAIAQLPTTSQWKNVSLTNSTRKITNENGENTTAGGTLPSNFSYSGYAARLLTIQEVIQAIGNNNIPDLKIGELDNFTYLLEKTKFASKGNAAWAWWLENSRSDNSTKAWHVDGGSRYVSSYTVSDAGDGGVRPAIEVAKTDIEY